MPQIELIRPTLFTPTGGSELTIANRGGGTVFYGQSPTVSQTNKIGTIAPGEALTITNGYAWITAEENPIKTGPQKSAPQVPIIVDLREQRLARFGPPEQELVTEVLPLGIWTETPGGPVYLGLRANYTTGTHEVHTVPITAATSTGTFLILGIKTGGGVKVGSVTDSAGNSWFINKFSANETLARVHIASTRITDALDTEDTITVKLASSTSMNCSAHEYLGIETQPIPNYRPVDKNVAASGSGTSAASGSTEATTAASELAISVLATGSADTGYTKPTGYTDRTGVGQEQLAVAEKILTTTGVQSATWTIPNGAWATLVQTYKAPLSIVPTYYTLLTTEPTEVTYNGTPLLQGSGTTLAIGEWFWDSFSQLLYINVNENPELGTVVASRTALSPQHVPGFTGLKISDFSPDVGTGLSNNITNEGTPGGVGCVTEVADPLGSGETVFKFSVPEIATIPPALNPRADMSAPRRTNGNYPIIVNDEFWASFKILLPSGVTYPTMSLSNFFGPPFGFGGSASWEVALIQFESPFKQFLGWQRLGGTQGPYNFDTPFVAPLTYDKWIHFLVHMKYATKGFVEMWVDGNPVIFFDPAMYAAIPIGTPPYTGLNPDAHAPTSRLEMNLRQQATAEGYTGPLATETRFRLDQYRSPNPGTGEYAGTLTTYHGPLRINNSRVLVGG